MDFFKVKRLRLGRKSKAEEEMDPEKNGMQAIEQWKEGITESLSKEGDQDGVLEEEDDDDDDVIANEVKKRLKELRKNSFMVLIPEESCLEEEEEEMSSSEWRESEVEVEFHWCGFDTLYISYCERMLYFDKMIVQHLKEAGSWNYSNQSPRYATKRLSLAFKSLSFKRQYDILGDCEQLQPPVKDETNHYLETAYVSQICLSWEILHCQYIQLSQQVSSQLENPSSSYGHSAQELQQFQVLLLRFIESEPFEQGSRVDIYARVRSSLPKLLQVPTLQGSDHKEIDSDDVDPPVLAPQLLNLIQTSILTFRCFLKRDKNKTSSSLSLFKGHNHDISSLHQVQTALAKKQMKVKELSKKKAWKKSWPATPIEVDLLFALIDIEIVKRVLRIANISKEQLLWCEEKMSKLDLSDNKLCRNGSPILFPL
ncbi:uncharacterized protein LOC110108938 [Dendrobium catenatum]|uniref:Uncharacterized protein n=1 Tax=Dendrobium catenatum TaxID=906689 RepID=A0A2I0VF77_9ASPA|nr:uncharacterized protein LOC110108938 [Dendrobium catenatum]PKU62045.1 hypothetical protein MA16_Dca012154 [Dendrobium catenatum]